MNRDETMARLKILADETAILRKSGMESLAGKLIDTAAVISGVIGSGNKILIAGNGGSAADASHFAGEMIVRLSADRNRQALPAIALSTDLSVITAAANDYGYENIFARQVEGLGRKGDMLIVISTSGNSPNLIRVVQIAKERSLLTLGLLGGDGGRLASMVDQALIIPHPSTQRIQEEQIFYIHLLVELIEADLV